MQVWQKQQDLLKSSHSVERHMASQLKSAFIKTNNSVRAKRRLVQQTLLKLQPVKLQTLKKYLQKLNEFKKQAFSQITALTLKDKQKNQGMPESAFEFIECNGPSDPSSEQTES